MNTLFFCYVAVFCANPDPSPREQEGIAYLRTKYPPLRGELWYRREPTSSGAKTGKKFLDVYFLEDTLPELLDLLLGSEGRGVGLAPEQVRRGSAGMAGLKPDPFFEDNAPA